MKRTLPADEIDALISALEAARPEWQDATVRTSVRRLSAHAAEATGAVPDSASPDDIDALVGQLLALRRPASPKTNVLIVEDDRLTARVLADALAAADRNIIIARSAAEATTAIREHNVDIILLDLVLPDGDGRDLLASLRATPATRSVPAVVVTARNDAITQAECFALGADTLLLKPVEAHVLVAAVCAHLAHAAERRREGRIDGLTMLPNRTAFLDAFERAAPLARRNNQPLALAMIDLDHFKSVNDTHGHAVGDEVLQMCARTIARALRTSDYVARWGGEEICVFLPDTTTNGAVLALDKALRAVRKLEFRAGDQVFSITFSAGVAALADRGSADDALKEADRLLYVAKTSGRNRIISPADEADPPRPRALLVEDDVAVATVVTRLLERSGFSVAHFMDGGGVLEAAAQEHFTFAIIDLNVPVMHGFELVEKMRKMGTASKLPILFLTGSDDQEDIVRGFQVGADDFVSKPFNSGELMARINRLLPKR